MSSNEEMINQAVIGKRVVAVAWQPVPDFEGFFYLDSMTLEGGARLEFGASSHGSIVFADLMEENDHADA